MDTRQLIEASATVITITSLKRGDVYKRIEDTPDYGAGSGPSLRFGVVTDVLNNGEDSAFTAVELTPTYNGVESRLRVFTAGKPAALFAATPEEFEQHTKLLQAAADRAVQSARETLAKAEEAQQHAGRVIAMALRNELTAPQTSAPTIALEA